MKKFFPKDFKIKRSEEIVHACAKTVDKVLNEGGGSSALCGISFGVRHYFSGGWGW